MELFLWRHADALPGIPDAARELSQHGRKQARKVAAWLAERAPKDLRLLVSPAVRTRQTVEYFNSNERDYELCPPLYDGASPNDVLALLDWPFFDQPTLIVGHQPLMGELAARLLIYEPYPGHFRKSALWQLDVEPGTDGARLVQVIDGDMLP